MISPRTADACSTGRVWPAVPKATQEVTVFEDVEDPQVDEDIRVEEIRRRMSGGQPR